MMEGAFFVSRTELLQWANGLLQVNLTKVEQCASGAVYCQIVDSCHPGTVKMSKLNWMAKADHEYVPNYKILQAAFDKNNIEKHIDVDKLIRAKYQDNLEFLQWMKAYWEREGLGRREYEPLKAREGRPVPAWAKALGIPTVTGPSRAESAVEKENVTTNRESGSVSQKFDPSARKPGAVRTAAVTAAATSLRSPKGATQNAPAASQADEELRRKLAEQAEELKNLRDTMDGLEQERDYYFKKLRNVEILCSHYEETTETLTTEKIIKDVQAILYAEDEDDGYENADAAVDLPLGEPPTATLESSQPVVA
jgi:RP/EB family microtubule-associated protein